MSPAADRIAIDTGNSSTKVGWFAGRTLLRRQRIGTDDWSAVLRGITNPGRLKIIYSTVANAPPTSFFRAVEAAGARIYPVRRDPFPFPTRYETPLTLGDDRLGAVAGARAFSAGAIPRPTLVVDAGSCITVDLVTAEGIHLGGNISPGIGLRLKAMADHTARLPRLQPSAHEHASVGLTTEQAVAAGGTLGAALELEALYHRLGDVHPKLQLLLTGGDGPLLLPLLPPAATYDSDLVLRGLIQILSTYDEP